VAEKLSPAMLGDAQRLQFFLEELPVLQGIFNAGTFATGIDGTAIASTPRSVGRVGVNYMERDHIAAALKEGKSSVSPPVFGKKIHAPVVALAVPIRDRQRKVIGALVGVVDLSKPGFMDKIGRNAYGRTGGYLLVVPASRLIISASEKDRVMETLPGPGVIPAMDRFLQGYEGSVVYVNPHGVEVLDSAKSVPVAGWYVSVGLPTVEAFSPIRSMQQRMLVATIFLTLVAGVLIWLMLKRQLLPMLSTVKTLATLSETNLPPQPLPIVRQDEIGDLIGGFNRLLGSLGQRQDALRREQSFSKSVLDSLPGIFYLYTYPEIELVLWNKQHETLLGYGADEMAGRLATDWFAPELKGAIVDAIEVVMDKGFNSIEAPMLAKDGLPVYLLLTGVRFESEGRSYFVGTGTDIRERKQAEAEVERLNADLEQRVVARTADLEIANRSLALATSQAEAANAAKSDFLANMSHELRTPLGAVIGMAGLARGVCTDPRQRDYLDKITISGKHLSRIINDLLDLSKITAGYLEFENVTFSLRQLLARCNSVMAYRMADNGLKQLETIDAAVPDALLGDPLRIEQIILNLVGNAIKFTPSGRIEVRVSLHAREADRVCLNIDVEDTGIGMRPEELERLFKPFSQGNETVSRQFGGTGLGLTISKRLASMMGGDISVTSREGCGSTFSVRLWLGLGNASDLLAVTEEAQKSAQVRYEGARVLVVDDQPFNREIAEGLLASVGIAVRLAGNGQEALDIVSSGTETFDLVLMDIQMPIMDGLVAALAIRSLDGFSALPIIAMTAQTMAHERERSVAAGMNDHIGKPFDEAGFYRVLAKWISSGKQHLQSVAATAPPLANAFPLLHGVDTRAGLALLQGDAARYRHWLGDFAVEAPATMQQVRHALNAGLSEAASMAVHALRGRTGLLGMNELNANALALEVAIDAAEPTSGLLLDLEQGVASMCAEIQCGLGL
jgi:PAS domain S-box-containing protein